MQAILCLRAEIVAGNPVESMLDFKLSARSLFQLDEFPLQSLYAVLSKTRPTPSAV
jgi:hypothetical protein